MVINNLQLQALQQLHPRMSCDIAWWSIAQLLCPDRVLHSCLCHISIRLSCAWLCFCLYYRSTLRETQRALRNLDVHAEEPSSGAKSFVIGKTYKKELQRRLSQQ